MQDFQSRRKVRRRVYSRLTLVVLVILTVWLGTAVWDVHQKNRHTKINKERAEAEMEDLAERKQALEDKIGKLQTDRGREEEIRRNLPVIREGERVIMVIDEKQATTTSSEVRKSFWQRWFTFE